MPRTEVVQEGRRRRRAAADQAAVTRDDRNARVAQALRLLARNADRWWLTRDPAETERCGKFQGRIWRAVERFGIHEAVLAGVLDRQGKPEAPAVRNWRRARLARV
jgi:hypothetical protein